MAEGESKNPSDGKEPPTGKIITTALEVAFRTVWIQLLTAGIGQEYEAAITDFCIACIAARKAGTFIPRDLLSIVLTSSVVAFPAHVCRYQACRLFSMAVTYTELVLLDNLCLFLCFYGCFHCAIYVIFPLKIPNRYHRTPSKILKHGSGYSLTTLKLELAANELTSDDPELQKMQLNEREKETRFIWIALVFLTLQRYNFNSGNTQNDDVLSHFAPSQEQLARGLKALVNSVCDAADKGYTLSTYKMEMQFNRKQGEEPLSPASLSIQSQWSRMVFTTIKILPEALKDPKKRF